MLDFIEFRAGQKQAMATHPCTEGFRANQREFHRFFELPRNMANPMEAIARATISIRSIIGLVFNHTRAFKSTEGLRSDLAMKNNISPLTFIDKLVKKNELGQPFKLMDHQREILRLAFTFDENGRLPWNTVIYSCVKKSGKTTLNGALTLWWAFTGRSTE